MLRIKRDMQTALNGFWSKLTDNDLVLTSIIQSLRLRDLGFNYSEISSYINKLIELEQKIIDAGFNDNDFTNMIIHLRSYLFTFELEEIRYIFAKLLDPSELRYQSDTDVPKLDDMTMNTILQRIGNKLGLDAPTRKTHRKLFFIDFRNAIIHGNYVVEGEILSYENEDGEQENLAANNFNRIKFEVDEIQYFIFGKYHDLLS